MIRPSVFLDADVIFAGAASPHAYGASHVLLRLGQYTILDCATSEQALTEVERNLSNKAASTLGAFYLIVRDCLRVVPNPTAEQLAHYESLADRDDLSILVAAVTNSIPRLLTFNTRHFSLPPSLILVQRPGEYLATLRLHLAGLARSDQ